MNVRLLREHRINRVAQPPGYECELPEQLATWLIEQGIVEPAARPTEVAAATTLPVAAGAPTSPLHPAWSRPKATGRCCGW